MRSDHLSPEVEEAISEHDRLMRHADEALRTANVAIATANVAIAAMRIQQWFISYRFDDEATEAYVQRLIKFLELIPVDVSTGAGFQPRSVSAKILELIGRCDVLLAVLTGAGQSAWLRDELSTAAANKKYVVVLVEEGQEFDPGVHGDVEYARFEVGHIEQTFVALMQAVRYIRQEWAEAARKRQSSDAELTGSADESTLRRSLSQRRRSR